MNEVRKKGRRERSETPHLGTGNKGEEEEEPKKMRRKKVKLKP